MVQDARLALRSLRSTPLVTAVAVLSLALGIGANTAIFSIFDSLLLRKLPVEEPDRLALVLSRDDPRFFTWSYMLWEQIRRHREQVFETAVAFSPTRFNLSERGETSFVDGLWVSGNFFSGLGVSPMLGRTLTDADDDRSAVARLSRPVAVISYAYWQRLGGRADIVGRTQMIGAVPFTIVGVMPQHFSGVVVGSTFDLAVPIAAEPLLTGPDSSLDRTTTSSLRIVARIKAGQTLTVAQDALRGVQPQIREAAVAAERRAVNRDTYLATPFALHSMSRGHSPVRDRYRQAVIAIMDVVALVLFIACANVANLLLAKADARRHELSVRLALGGSRWRLARPLLVEGAMLAGVAAAIGLAMAQWGSALMVQSLSTRTTTMFLDTQINWRTLTFTAAVAATVAVAFAVLPAIRVSGSRPMDVIRAHGRDGSGGGRAVSSALVAMQVALSLVLVVGAGLFLRSFTSLTTVDLGFDRSAVLLARFDASRTGVAPAERGALFQSVLDWFATYGMPLVAGRGLALLLAGLGLYGVTWYSVTRRRTELGIRMAVGAAPADVVQLVLRRVVVVVAVGTVVGMGLSLWTSKYVSTLLYGLEPRDPITIASSALVLVIVSAVAGWAPAHRAARIDPSHVLRDA